MDYFSASVVTIVLVRGAPAKRRNHYDRSVIVFRARGVKDAVRRATALGRAQQCSYMNSDGDLVCWRLVEVEQVTKLGPSVDHMEVWSSMFHRVDPSPIPASRRFLPEQSPPYVTDNSVSGRLDRLKPVRRSRVRRTGRSGS
jgi:hypothetical protein